MIECRASSSSSTSVSLPPRSDLRAEAERWMLGKRAWLEKASFAHAGSSSKKSARERKNLGITSELSFFFQEK